MEALNVLFSGANLLYVCFIAELPLEKYGGSLITVNIFLTVKSKGYDTYGIENFGVGRKDTKKGIFEKVLLIKWGSSVQKKHVLSLYMAVVHGTM